MTQEDATKLINSLFTLSTEKTKAESDLQTKRTEETKLMNQISNLGSQITEIHKKLVALVPTELQQKNPESE